MRKFFNNLSGNKSNGEAEGPERTEDVINVKHGKNDYEFQFPLGAISSGAVTVGALRAKASKETGVDANRISLVGLGRNLKDDSATLRSLGMGSGTKVLCMASQQKPISVKKPVTAAPPKLLGPGEKIEAVKQAVQDKTGALTQEFVSNPPTDAKEREDTHRKISETIMGELLKLDGIESDDPAVRLRRKEVVKEIQRVLETLDAALKKGGPSL
ncbi:BAG domain-containing protein [Tirmania nivea]|nr:BAG domain-containing protein [Tirmania nivea]